MRNTLFRQLHFLLKNEPRPEKNDIYISEMKI